MARILVIEDDRDLQKVLDFNLRQAGHEVLSAMPGTTNAARRERRRTSWSSTDIPDLAGTEVCRARKDRGAGPRGPMLTAKGEEVDRVVGFELGADDYVIKPFAFVAAPPDRRHPAARQGRRGRQACRPSSSAVSASTATRIVCGSRRRVELTALEFKLSVLLPTARTACRVGRRCSTTSGASGGHHDPHGRHARKRLREARPRELTHRTVRGVGYRFAETPDEADE